jgi:cysteinyl-tRNA synthetase
VVKTHSSSAKGVVCPREIAASPIVVMQGCLHNLLSERRFILEFWKDMEALNCLPPSREPRATEHIADMLDMISRIMHSGHAYESEGNVWFSVDSIDGYGRLSGRSLVRAQQ